MYDKNFHPILFLRCSEMCCQVFRSLSLASCLHRLNLLVHGVDLLLAELQGNISLEFEGCGERAVLLRVKLVAELELFRLLQGAKLVFSGEPKHVFADLFLKLIVAAKLFKTGA